MQLQIRLHIRLVVALVFLGAMPTAVFETVGSAFGIAAAADESTAAADVDNARLVLQAVGTRVESYFDRVLRADERGRSRMVVIGMHDMDRPAIEAVLRG